MKPIRQDKSLLDRLLWMAVLISMAVSAAGEPLSLGAFFLLPTPLIIINLLLSPVTAMMTVLGMSALFAWFRGFQGGLGVLLLIGLFSQLQATMIRRGSRVSRVLFWSTSFVLGAALTLLTAGRFTGEPQGLQAVQTLSLQVTEAIRSSTYGEAFASEEVRDFIPAFILYLTFLFSAANFFLARWVVRQRGISVIPLNTLGTFQLPKRILEGMAAQLLLGYGVEAAGLISGQTLTSTLLYVATFALMFQGMGLCAFLMDKRQIPPAGQGLVLIGMLLIAGPAGLGLAGLADIAADIRKQRRTGGTPG